jgi:hypothetical protein
MIPASRSPNKTDPLAVEISPHAKAWFTIVFAVIKQLNVAALKN